MRYEPESRTVGWVITSTEHKRGTEWMLVRKFQEKGIFGYFLAPVLSTIVGWFDTEEKAIEAMKERCDPRKCSKWYNADGSEPVGL